MSKQRLQGTLVAVAVAAASLVASACTAPTPVDAYVGGSIQDPTTGQWVAHYFNCNSYHDVVRVEAGGAVHVVVKDAESFTVYFDGYGTTSVYNVPGCFIVDLDAPLEFSYTVYW